MSDDTKPGLELTHEQTVARMKDVRDEIERLSKRDDLDESDEVRWDGLKTEFVNLREHKKELERKADLAEIRSAFDGTTAPRVRVDEGVRAVQAADNSYDVDPMADVRSAEDKSRRNPWDLTNMRTYGRDGESVVSEIRSRALDAVEKMPGANDSVRSAAARILEETPDRDGKLARYALASSDPAYMRAFSKTARNPHQPNLTTDESRAVERANEAFRAMSLTDNAGGYLVPFQLDPTVIITSNGSRNQVRNIARQVVATGDVWNGVSAGAVSFSWDAEATEVSDDTPTFAQPSIANHKAQGFVPISIEALADAANATTEVGRLLAFGKDTIESQAFVTGTGSGQPTGIVTALTGTGSVVASATADTFAIGDVYGLDSALPARYRGSASWLANRAIYNRVRQFDTSGGAGLWERVGNGLPAELVGRPAYEAEAMDGSITATEDNLALIFGDFENYVITDRVGFQVEFIPHLFGANRRPTGQRGWYAYFRVGADSVNDGAFRMLNVT
jgi:HK97 family phage major capsid protein